MGNSTVNSGNRSLIIGAINVRGFNFTGYREIKAGAIISTATLTLTPATGITAGSATVLNDTSLWSSQASNTTSAEFPLDGITPLTILGTFGGATVTLQVSTDGGTTWLDYQAWTSALCVNVNIPTAMLGRLVLTGATGTTSISATVELGNIVTFQLTPETAGTYTAKCLATLDNGLKIAMKGTFNVMA